jgi:ABC-type transport system involved in cytochrome bd biosynthesis fused ATPase/permease subunit
VLFATHRLHWIGSMDRVIELKGGKIERIRTVTEGGDAR